MTANYIRIRLDDNNNDDARTTTKCLSQQPDDEVVRCVRMIRSALDLRRKYMLASVQTFPHYLANFLIDQQQEQPDHAAFNNSNTKDDNECKYGGHDETIGAESSSRDQFLADYFQILNFMGNKELDEYCRRRLKFLRLKFDMHTLLNERAELEEQKRIEGVVDFARVHKVDTHIHASCSMTQTHLLEFIKRKLDSSGDDLVVVKNYKGTGEGVTLSGLFADLGLKRDQLNLDSLGIRATNELFCRFDRFNARFSPFEKVSLRDVFLKVDNDLDGQFYAEIIQEVFDNLERSKFTKYELRVSVYGRAYNEWDNLARWFHRHQLSSPNNRWMIQVPKIYDLFKKNRVVENFEQMLANFFRPLFEVTHSPDSHPELDEFLKHISGFDSVDDESKVELESFDASSPPPTHWTRDHNPPYAYYIYYFYANIRLLNQHRARRGLNTFHFRPHCGEAGDVHHLAAGFLLAQNISHGTLLKSSSVLQYLFYLSQIGVATSPSANHYLYVRNCDSPFYDFHRTGLNISLSTDSPLHFYFSEDPLLEDFAVLSKLWNLNSVDLCELARASVLMSSFTTAEKEAWLGVGCSSSLLANEPSRTNVPQIRIAYRAETLLDELNLLLKTK